MLVGRADILQIRLAERGDEVSRLQIGEVRQEVLRDTFHLPARIEADVEALSLQCSQELPQGRQLFERLTARDRDVSVAAAPLRLCDDVGDGEECSDTVCVRLCVVAAGAAAAASLQEQDRADHRPVVKASSEPAGNFQDEIVQCIHENPPP